MNFHHDKKIGRRIDGAFHDSLALDTESPQLQTFGQVKTK